MKVLDRAISSQMLLSLLITVSDCMVLTKFHQRNVNHRWSEVFVDDHLAHSDLGPSKYLSSVPVITDCDPIPNLLASLVFLLLWTPSMMEKEEAGSISSLSSLNRQWAAVSANRLPICEQQLDEQTNKLGNYKFLVGPQYLIRQPMEKNSEVKIISNTALHSLLT